ncbi:hypothetical protein [Radiobacillus sp. PE A8.2]|uniref:hypothetical protein n=1 Tax=Radiobacillus sp. PE A8.2 TaxID=3380349 RepID=UPI00388EC11A
MRNVLLFLSLVLLIGCQDDGTSMQEQRLSIDAQETTNEDYLRLHNPGPNGIDELGDKRNVKSDRQSIQYAVERMPGVTVDEVTFEQITVFVTVTVDRALTKTDKLDWQAEIASAIRMVIPYDQIKVQVN